MSSLVSKKSEYEVSDEVAKALVDGIVAGIKNFATDLVAFKEGREIYSAFMFSRPQYVDNAVMSEINALSIVESDVKKAGAWQYLRVKLATPALESALLIVKRANYIPKSNKRNPQSKTYIEHYMDYNKSQFKSSGNAFKVSEGQLELSVPYEEPTESNNTADAGDYKGFYILTYDMDQKGNITKVALNLPNPFNGRMLEIQDLSQFILNEELSKAEIEALSESQEQRYAATEIEYMDDSGEEESI